MTTHIVLFRGINAGGNNHLHAPDGIGRSKPAANAEKLLGIPTTARDWRTVRKLMEMADQHG